jgi:hypothetical protein
MEDKLVKLEQRIDELAAWKIAMEPVYEFLVDK